MGVVSAILKFAGVDIFQYFKDWNSAYGEAVAIIPFVLLVIYMIRASLKSNK